MSFRQLLLATASLTILVPCVTMAQTPAAAAAATPPAAAVAPATAPAPTAAATPAATAAAAPAAASATISNPNAPVTRGEFEALLRETLAKDPQMILDSVKKLHEQRQAETEKQMKEALAKHKATLAADTTSPRIGNTTDSDVTVYEFFDYHCGYCKHMLPTLTQLVETDKKVQVVLLDFPILSEDSVEASRASIAAYMVDKEKYFAFHGALLKTSGKFDDKALSDAAKKAGIDWKKIKKEMATPAVTEKLDKVRAIAEDIGIRGTPAFIIGDEILPGAVPLDDMKQILDAIRKGEKPSMVGKKTKSTAETPPPRDPSQPAAEKKPAEGEKPAAN